MSKLNARPSAFGSHCHDRHCYEGQKVRGLTPFPDFMTATWDFVVAEAGFYTFDIVPPDAGAAGEARGGRALRLMRLRRLAFAIP